MSVYFQTLRLTRAFAPPEDRRQLCPCWADDATDTTPVTVVVVLGLVGEGHRNHMLRVSPDEAFRKLTGV